MKKWVALLVLASFALGLTVGLAAAKVKWMEKSLYSGKDPKESAAVLLEAAKVQAGSGSWENIGIGRVYYLMGNKTEGQSYFDKTLGGKAKVEDWMRVGRAYAEAGDWAKAEAVFKQVLEMAPKDEDNLAEIGAYYNLNGNRAKAEELFDRSFQLKMSVWNTLRAAGSYVGVKPQ